MASARRFVSLLRAIAPIAPSLLGQRSAFAGETDPAAAEVLFQRGRDAAAKGNLAQACAHFAESLRLDPAPGTRLNLADCEERTGQLARAWQDFEVAASQLPSSDARHAFAKAHASALEARLPRLVIRLTGTVAGAHVTRDGVELGASSFGIPLPVDPGRHVVVLTMADAPPRSLEVVVAERETRELVLEGRAGSDGALADRSAREPSRQLAPAKAAEAPSASDGRGRRVCGFAALGVGAAGVALGTVAGLLAFDGAADVRAHCDAERRCDAEGLDGGARARSWSTVSTIAFAAGLVGVAVGGYALLVSPRVVGTGASTIGLRGSF